MQLIAQCVCVWGCVKIGCCCGDCDSLAYVVVTLVGWMGLQCKAASGRGSCAIVI